MIVHQAYKKYDVFEGCASRQEFWSFLLLFIAIHLMIFGLLLLGNLGGPFIIILLEGLIFSLIIGAYPIFLCLHILPIWSLCIRRLHDINKSGALLLLVLLPIIGMLVLAILFCIRPVTNHNRYSKKYSKEKHVILSSYQKYAVFEGRTSRYVFWAFVVFLLLVVFTIYACFMWLWTAHTLWHYPYYFLLTPMGSSILNIFACIIFLCLNLIPFAALLVRRFHDTNRSGWFLLLLLIPVIGQVAIIITLCLKGTPGDNRYGANPYAKQNQQDTSV